MTSLTPNAEDFERARRWRGPQRLPGEHWKRVVFSPMTWTKRRARDRRFWRRSPGLDLWDERRATRSGHATGCLYCGTPWAKDCPEPIPF